MYIFIQKICICIFSVLNLFLFLLSLLLLVKLNVSPFRLMATMMVFAACDFNDDINNLNPRIILTK